MKVSFIVERTSTGFSAYAADFSNLPVATTGGTMTELKENILDAVNLYLDYTGKEPVTAEDISASLDLPQFFEYYKVINAKVLSSRIGINNTLLSQYVNGVKKPSEKQVKKILDGVKELGKELAGLELS
jgi:hypothetical protein